MWQKISIERDDFYDYDWYFDDELIDYYIGGNDRLAEIGTDNEWYIKAKNIDDELAQYYSYYLVNVDDYNGDENKTDDELHGDYYWLLGEFARDFDISVDVARKVFELYTSSDFYLKDGDTLVELLNVLYPDRNFESSTLHGKSQSDWNDIVYDANTMNREALNEIEDYYMGNVRTLFYEDSDGEESNTSIGYSELFDITRLPESEMIARLFELVDYPVECDNIIIVDKTGYSEDYLVGDEDLEEAYEEEEYNKKAAEEYEDLSIDVAQHTIGESRRLRRSKRVMSSSRLHPSRRRSVKASRSVRRGRR